MIKNFQEYEELALSTKSYDNSIAIPYVSLGLGGETNEFLEKIDDEAELDLTLKEVGDILWYVAACRVEMNLTELYFPIVTETFDTPFKLTTPIGHVLEQTKKYLRDDWKKGQTIELSEDRKEIIHNSLQIVLEELSKFCLAVGTNLTIVAQQNIEKLADRSKRNVIKGSGDER